MLARGAVVTAAYALPYAAVVAVVGFAGYGLLRRRRRTHETPPEATEEN